MSNATSSADGFRPVKHMDGRDYVGGGRPHYLPSTDATNVFVGDAVVRAGGSNSVDILPTGSVGGAVNMPAGSLPIVVLATAGAGNKISGIVVRVCADPIDNARAVYRKASTAAVVFVEDSADVLYTARLVGASGTTQAATAVGNTISLLAGTGNTVTGRSGHGLDGATIQTSSGTTQQFRIVSFSRDPLNNDLSAANPKLYVAINNAQDINAATAVNGS